MARKLQVLVVLGWLAAVAIAQVPIVVVSEDFCDPKLCKKGREHIGCKGTLALGPECVDGERYTFDDKLKKILLDEHNKYRNQVAKGEVEGLPKAANMVTMDWDDDLAYLAEVNAVKCDFEHDKCHNTKKYPKSGQNLSKSGTTDTKIDIEATLKELVQEWWDERKFATKEQMEKLFNNGQSLHFTMLARSNANKVGCGMVRYKSGEWIWVQLSCNYSYTNMIGTPVYKAGEPCSECKTGCDSKWDGLCTKDEPVDIGVKN